MTLRRYEKELIGKIREHGWFCMSVFDPEGKIPNFSYSVGFWESVCAPELIVFGLEIEVMHEMLWIIYRRLKEGAQLTDGGRWPGILEGCDCVSRPVHQSQIKIDYFNSALWYHEYRTGSRTLQAYQIFWPGAQDGLLPWAAGAAEIVRERQPPLYLPDERGIA